MDTNAEDQLSELGRLSWGEGVAAFLDAAPKGSEAPRSWEEMQRKLVDIAITILVAVATIDPQAQMEIDSRLREIVDPLGSSDRLRPEVD